MRASQQQLLCLTHLLRVLLVLPSAVASLLLQLKLSSTYTGRRPKDETPKHGEIPPEWLGHDSSRCKAQSEQLEPAVSLVTLEETLRPWKGS